MKNLIIAFALAVSFNAAGQTKLNTILKRQLDSVYVLDQKYRQAMTEISNPAKRDSIAKAVSMPPEQLLGYFDHLQRHIDSLNLLFIEKTLKQYGYPGKILVGEPTNEAVWNVIQHSPNINQYLPLIKKAAESNELPFNLYAMMLDRELKQQGKEQIYGSQLQMQKMKSGKVEMFVWPIQDPETVNERRKKAGFDLTVEQNAKRFNTVYRVVKMDEIK
jgi:hypothetical protein